jgi:hypothetical protein
MHTVDVAIFAVTIALILGFAALPRGFLAIGILATVAAIVTALLEG